MYRKPSINTTLIITVELFVTTSQLARDQTSVIMLKIGAHRVLIHPAGEEFTPPVKIPVTVKI